MEKARKTCCILKLCSDSKDLDSPICGALWGCCQEAKPLQSFGKMLLSPAVQGSSSSENAEKCISLPIVHLDGVKEWTVNESFYVIGLSAWLQLKRFVSLFSDGFSVKVGTAVPCLFQSPPSRRCFVWHTIEGFPHEVMGVKFEKTNKIWLKLPIAADSCFQCLVMDTLGLHVFKTMCFPSAEDGCRTWNLKLEQLSSRLLYGIEQAEDVAVFFADSSYEDSRSQQYISNIIFEPDDGKLDYTAGSPSNKRSQCNDVFCSSSVQQEECVVEEMTMQLIKPEVKAETEHVPPVSCPKQNPFGESGLQTSVSVTVKCPGCLASFPADVCSLRALSHHIINSHRMHSKKYRNRLRVVLSRVCEQGNSFSGENNYRVVTGQEKSGQSGKVRKNKSSQEQSGKIAKRARNF